MKKQPPPGTIKTSISLPADVYALGQQNAKRRDRPFSAYVRFLIRNDRIKSAEPTCG